MTLLTAPRQIEGYCFKKLQDMDLIGNYLHRDSLQFLEFRPFLLFFLFLFRSSRSANAYFPLHRLEVGLEPLIL